MSFCPQCLRAIGEEPKKPDVVLHGTAQGRFYLLWRRQYDDFRKAASYCRICADIFSYQFDTTNHEHMKEVLDLSERDRDKLFVTCELFWRSPVFDRLIIKFVDWREDVDADADADADADGDNSELVNGFVGYDIFTSDDISITPNALFNNGYKDYVPLLRNWLEICSMHHSGCNVQNEDYWLPTRLIDVGCDDGFQDVHLSCTNHQVRGSSYVTLSHRWIDGQMPTLTTGNIKDLRRKGFKSLGLNGMPQTFLDAIEITRALGIKYLWIDSLCILQDSQKDWEHESSMMGKVYALGRCNLAATGASCGGKGLYQQLQGVEDGLDIFRCAFECNWNSHIPSRSRTHYLLRERLWDLGVEQAELNQRGWVIQERFLSPRTVHFGLERLFWECRQAQSFSSVCHGSISELLLPEHVLSWSNRKSWREITAEAKVKYSVGTANLNEVYEAWHTLRAAYVKTSVTYQSDKLIAISGLAGYFQELFKDQYLAGLWRKTLIYDLLWSTKEPRTRTVYAPSWSWASIGDGTILWAASLPQYPHERHELARIFDAKVISSTANTAGQPRQSYVKMQGFVFLLDTKDGDGPFKSPVEWPEDFEDYLADLEYENYTVRLDEEEWVTAKKGYFCIHLLLTNGILGSNSGESVLHGLVLKPTAENGKDFTRAGYFHCDIMNLQDYYAFLDCACSVQDGGKGQIYQPITIF